MRLLIAEDDPRLLKTLLHIFGSSKFSADGVANGEDALAYARSKEYDGLVLDIMMPGMDGLQVLQTLRGEGISTPALFLTARTEVSQRVRGWTAVRMTTCPSRFPPPSCSRACAPCCGARTPICPTCSPSAR